MALSIEDRRRLDSPREGMVEGYSLGNYLLFVDYTGRLYREGKAVISAKLGPSWSGWAAAGRTGRRGCGSWPAVVCWVGSSRRRKPGCGKWRSGWAASPGQPGRVHHPLRPAKWNRKVA